MAHVASAPVASGERGLSRPSPPLTDGQVERWRQDGGLLVPGWFETARLRRYRSDLDKVYAMQPAEVIARNGARANDAVRGAFRIEQLQAIRSLPAFGAPDLNALALDEKLLAAVRQLLGFEDIRLYSNYAWHKEADGTDHNQPFHCDYPTHQLLVPPEDSRLGAVNVFVYLTDVTPETGPLGYVPMRHSSAFGIHQAQPSASDQALLAEHEAFVTCPAGSVFFYNTRVYHRGTNLTGAGAVRDVVGAGFRRGDTPWVAPRHGEFPPTMPQWRELFEMCGPGQLAALGIPLPGHPYWTPAAIRGVEARYPGWNSDPWREAAGLPLRAHDRPSPPMLWPTVKDVSGVDLDALRAAMDARAEQPRAAT